VRQGKNSILLQISISVMPVAEASLTLYRSFINTSFSGSSKQAGDYRQVVRLPFDFCL